MKLLSKQEINARKALERKQQIDEGVKLARKVDNLRELSSQEDAALKKFRTETLARISEEIESLDQKRATLVEEVGKLERKRLEAVAPLEKEMALLEKKQIKAQVAREEAEKAIESLQIERKNLLNLRYTVKKEKGRAESALIEAAITEESAEDKLKEAEKALEHARSLDVQAKERYDLLTEELSSRETALLGRERDTMEKEKLQTEREKMLNERDRLIKDRYATLLRTEQRIYGRRK